jgi:hypothetical protein
VGLNLEENMFGVGTSIEESSSTQVNGKKNCSRGFFLLPHLHVQMH